MSRQPEEHINFREIFAGHGKLPALVSRERTVSYQDYYRLAACISAILVSHGFKKGERAGILSDNSPEYVIILMALWKAGVVAVPLNTRWTPAAIGKSLTDIVCEKILLSPAFYDVSGFNPLSKFLIQDFVNQADSKSKAEKDEEDFTDLMQDVTIVFTSGSSGTPKGALHSLANHYYNALGSNQNIPFAPDDRWLLSLPLFHVGGLAILFRALLGGGAVAIPDPALELAENLRELEATHVSLVPTQFYWLLQSGAAIDTMRRMKAILLGGSAIPDSLLRQAAELELQVFTSYGSSEMSSQITTTHAGDGLAQWRSSGRLLPFRELKIAADSEILVKGKTLFKGYVSQDAGESILDAAGWFHSGDLGFWDENGYLHVLGRKDNMFISGGENIQPEEIEQLLLLSEGVSQAVVVPVSDREYGQRPVAFLELQKGGQPDADLFRKYLLEKLPRYKMPDHFFPWPEEAGNTMKIQRAQFSELAERLLHDLPSIKK
ncbi:MAG: o-succinylbenzoate--CoA ligase [Calditrichia bacterium]